MLVIRDPDSVSLINDPDIRELIDQRFIDMSDGEDYEVDLQVIVVEVGDSVASLKKESGCPILHNLCDDIRYGQPGFFRPCFEVLEEHSGFYEMVFVPGDGDGGIVIIIPKQEGIDSDLLAMCEEHAVPAP